MAELQVSLVVVFVATLLTQVAASSDDPGDGTSIAKRFEELERRLRDHESAIQRLEKKSEEQQSTIQRLENTVTEHESTIKGLEKKATEQDSTIQTQQEQIHQLLEELSTEHKAREGRHQNEDGEVKPYTVQSGTGTLTPTKRQERIKTAFTVILDHDIETGHQTVKFNKIITNEGNGYNIHSGVFTCMEPGMYLFIFNIGNRGASGFRGIWANLVVNSKLVVGSAVDVFHSEQDLQGGNAAILRLNTGDVVWIESHGGHIEGAATGDSFTSFSGTFLYP